MPIRFQVDPDFYDHPKVTGMSDTAFSLWVRAGSFSAAKLTNGSVSDDVLTHTLRSSAEVADELVRRGLWKRRKGGYVFHQWEQRNLTKERVDNDRKKDAARKRTAREKGVSLEPRDTSNAPVDNPSEDFKNEGQSGKKQVKTPNVRPDSERNPSAVQPESERNPDVSVSVSVSSSSGDSSRGSYVSSAREKRPPSKCPRHINHDDPPPCGPCGDARRAAERWDIAQRTAIHACRLCDGDGRRWHPDGRRHGTTGPCDHQPPHKQRADP